MGTRRFLWTTWLLGALCGGCGGGGDSGGGSVSPPPNTSGTNVGVGWIRITHPTSTGAFVTDQATVTVEGTSFVPVGFVCPPLVIPVSEPTPAGYEVRWSNSSTSTSFWVGSRVVCWLSLASVSWTANVPLAMGANPITFTVTDGVGNVGKSTIVVTRIPDTTPPTVISVSPINGETGVAIDANMTMTFSELMDQATINTATIILKDGANNPVIATVTYNRFSSEATLKPTNWLAKNTTYHATVTTDARDASGGNALGAPYSFSFTTGSGLQFPPIL